MKKKKCLGGHPGPCHHRSQGHQGTATTDSSVRSDSVTTQGEPETDTELLPGSAEVVFRAVSPHGHVYWEIDPKRPNKLAEQHSDSDTNNDMHNMSDFSEEDGRVASDRSRQSSSRFSDNRPLISGPGHPSLAPGHSSLAPLPEHSASLIQFSPQRFSSLHRSPSHQQEVGFSTRTRLGRHPRGGRPGGPEGGKEEEHGIPEQVQQQVQIPDLRRINVSVKSSEYIMAKIQSHMEQRKQTNGHGVKEREV